jgi:hypothetical protein
VTFQRLPVSRAIAGGFWSGAVPAAKRLVSHPWQMLFSFASVVRHPVHNPVFQGQFFNQIKTRNIWLKKQTLKAAIK